MSGEFCTQTVRYVSTPGCRHLQCRANIEITRPLSVFSPLDNFGKLVGSGHHSASSPTKVVQRALLLVSCTGGAIGRSRAFFSTHYRLAVHCIVLDRRCVLPYGLQSSQLLIRLQIDLRLRCLTSCVVESKQLDLASVDPSRKLELCPSADAKAVSPSALRMNHEWPAQAHTTQRARTVNSCRYLVCMMTVSCVGKYILLQS
jgi:hypothetical protein